MQILSYRRRLSVYWHGPRYASKHLNFVVPHTHSGWQLKLPRAFLAANRYWRFRCVDYCAQAEFVRGENLYARSIRVIEMFDCRCRSDLARLLVRSSNFSDFRPFILAPNSVHIIFSSEDSNFPLVPSSNPLTHGE